MIDGHTPSIALLLARNLPSRIGSAEVVYRELKENLQAANVSRLN